MIEYIKSDNCIYPIVYLPHEVNSVKLKLLNGLENKLEFKLELKSFDAVKLYSKTENYKAAVTSSEIFIDKYMNSRFSEEVNYIHVKNSVFLAKNSIESKKEERIDQSKERFLNFVKNYEKSIYFKELNSLINSFSLKQN